jgi:hypothetical protein
MACNLVSMWILPKKKPFFVMSFSGADLAAKLMILLRKKIQCYKMTVPVSCLKGKPVMRIRHPCVIGQLVCTFEISYQKYFGKSIWI